MKYLKGFNESLSIDDNIRTAYEKYTSQGITNEEELRKLILEYVRKENSLGMAFLMRGGMSKEAVEETMIFNINKFFRQLKKKSK